VVVSGLVTVSNTLIAAILDGIPLSEEEKSQLIADVGLSSATVRDVDGRTSLLTLSRLWNQVLDLTGDPFIGLHIGATIPGDRFGLAAHVAVNSGDFRQVLVRFAKFAALINGMIKCSLEETPEAARFTMKFYWDVLDLERHAVDISFVAVVIWARDHLGEAFKLREVRLKHALASAQRRYEEIFGVPIVFGASLNELVFDRAALEEVIREGNVQLGQILDRYATTELSKIPILTSLPSRVSQILNRELLQGEKPDLASVSRELKMAERHVQRKLSESSTSFSALLDEARKALAPALLVEPSANVEQVGFRLGYGDPTAFIRAFKKWYGMTPGQYRRERA
jgi:AraC-like DNA-binding protein